MSTTLEQNRLVDYVTIYKQSSPAIDDLQTLGVTPPDSIINPPPPSPEGLPANKLRANNTIATREKKYGPSKVSPQGSANLKAQSK